MFTISPAENHLETKDDSKYHAGQAHSIKHMASKRYHVEILKAEQIPQAPANLFLLNTPLYLEEWHLVVSESRLSLGNILFFRTLNDSNLTYYTANSRFYISLNKINDKVGA